MEPGQSGDDGQTGSRRPPPESTEIGVEEFLRSAYQSGLISSTGGERLLAHFDAMKAQAASASEPPAADTELADSRTAAALLIDRVSAAGLRGEVPEQQVDALKASLENACRGDDAAHIQAVMFAADRALKRAMQSPPVQAERRPDGAERERTPERAAPETAQRPPARPASTPRPKQARPPADSEPAPQAAARRSAPTPTETPAERARAAATRPAEPPRQPATPSRTPAAAVKRPPGPFARLGTAMRSAWKTTTADFAANTLTYIGVLLAVIVIFVFFAFGYFGEVVSEPNLRPPFFVAVPLFFFGIAWVLRTRTGLPIAATAIGMLGALTVPVMLAALFRDWAPFPPDLHGPDRYWGYALVGVVSALIYFYLATRQRIYAYLVAPMLWAAAGSLGLYWKDGMSGPQLFTALAAIITTFVVAARHQTGRVAELVAVPAVRVGVVAAPFVFVVSLVFAYDDAIRSGVAEPGIEDLAQPGAIAAALLAIVLGLASGMDFAWSGLGPRTRAALRVGLRVLAYVTVGVALLLVLALEVTAGWIGVALLGYGVAVLAVDRLVRGTGEAALWIGRGTIVVGLVLAATEPVPTIMAWTLALLISAARAALPRIRSATSPFFPIPTTSAWWLTELWVPAFVVAFLGVARAVEPVGVPWILVAATGVAAGTRWLPPLFRALRTYAIFPAVVFGIASFASTIWLHVAVEPFTDAEMGALLAGLAAATALIWIPWVWRAPFVVGLAIAGADLLIADVAEPDAAAAVLVQTLLFVTAGVVLLGASFVPRWRRWTYPNGLLGHLSLYAAVAVGVQSEDAALVALGALVLIHAAEAVAVQRGTSPFFAEAAVLAGSSRSLVEAAPATIAAVAALPLGILIGQQIPWLRAERARSAITFGVLALAYTAAAFWLRKPARWILVVLAYITSSSAIVVAFPSRPASIVAVTAAALATFGLAAVVRRPGASALSWILSLIGIVLVNAQLGVDQSNLYFPLFGTGILMVISGGTLNLVRGQRPGISNPWMVPPILVGVISIPIALAFAIAAGSWVWLLAGAAAAAIAYLGWAAGTGGVTVAVAAYAGIAYANVLSFEVNIFVDEPVYWMPFAAALVLASGLLPGRRGWRLLHDASPGALLAGLGAAAMATTLAFPAGSGAPVMALSSLLLGLVWILRRDDAWLHAGVIVLGSAAAVAGEGWLPGGLAVAAFIETSLAELRRDQPEALVYRWVGAGFWVGAYASFVYWAGWDAGTVTIVTITIGAALSGIALAAYLLAPEHRITDMWLWPATAVGQIALLGAGLYAGSTLTTTDTFLTWAALATIEALLVATYATVRIDQASTWIATGLGTAALGFLAAAFPTEPINLIRVTGPAGAAILAAWALLTITHQPERLALWRWPSLALAQTALAITATLAAINLDPTPAAGTLAAITAWEALTFTTVATATTTKLEALVAAGFALVSYDAALRWLELDATVIPSAWIALTLVALGGATFASHRVSSSRAGIWMWPLHGAGMAAGVMTLIAAAVYLSPTDARLLGAAVVAAAAIHLLANRSVFTPYMPVDSVAATAIVGAGALATTTLDADSSWTFVVLLAMALIGAVAPLIIDRLGEERIQPAIILVIGYGVIPVAAAAVFWGPLAAEVGYLLIVSGGALAGYGIVTHRLMALEAAAAVWLGSMLILLNDRFGLELHATIVLVAAVLLAVLEVERHRHLRKGQAQPEALRISEWIVMAVPLLIAAIESFETLAYVLVLGAEGLALLVWAGLTRVRRRAVMGLVAVTTAIVLGVTIPMFEEVRRGLTGGAWLAVGAIAAVVLIAAGSLIERQRIQIGKRLSQWGEILEDWE